MRKVLSRLPRRALAIVLLVAFATPAFAEDGLSPTQQRRQSDMDSSRWAAGECLKDTGGFSDYEYTHYTMNVMREIGVVTMSGGVPPYVEGPVDTYIGQLTDTLRTLSQCRFDKYSRGAASRALSGCDVLVHELYAMEEEAKWEMKHGRIPKDDWYVGIEKFLPAVQACRDKLGKCFNPNSKRQSKWAASLFAVEAYIDDISGGKSSLYLGLPACSQTMLAAGDDKPDPKDPNYVGYASMVTKTKWAGDPNRGGK